VRLGRSAAASDTGRKRRRNEDAFVNDPPLFAVADGMGGAQAGEVASRLAATALRDNQAEEPAEERVVSLIQEANRRVYERSSEDAAVSGMGTTMTVALVEDRRVLIGHVGDSRAYLVRDGRLEQLTEDHSLIAELLRSGKLSPEEAVTHPQRSVITRAIGTDPDVDVDTFTIEPKAGDVFLLCSDGLTDMIDDETIRELVERHHDDLDAVAKALIRAANKAGGVDNITVVAFEIAADQTPQLDATQPLPVQEASKAPDEEDTLTEADRIPVINREDTQDAEAPVPGLKRRLVSATIFLLLVAGIVALVVWGFWSR
jgi:PPM family protein phosphatase